MQRLGLFSDVHANLPAFRAVLDALDREGCDALVCAGDVVGYGPFPTECVALVREREIPCVLGNHEHYVTLIMESRLDRLSADVRAVVEWTQNELSMDDLRWLAQLPRQLDLDGFSVVHGCFGPNPWRYLVSDRAFARCFEHQEAALAFSGHSHIPLLAYERAGLLPFCSYLKSGPVPDLAKVMVGVGSVGQPRDHDSRAACAVYDPADRELRILRLEYDIAETQARIREQGLPERYATRLDEGR